jgi:hypothetical protein
VRHEIRDPRTLARQLAFSRHADTTRVTVIAFDAPTGDV